MSTTECVADRKLLKAPGLAPHVTVMVRIKSAWRAIRNRMAANALSDLDDRMLDDLGISRRDVVAALDRSGALDDPSLLLAGAARERARHRFAHPAKH